MLAVFSSCQNDQAPKDGVQEDQPADKPAEQSGSPDQPGIHLNEADTIQLNMKGADGSIHVKDGPVAIPYENGAKRIEGTMKDGNRHGVWKAYYENGVLWSITNYVDGRLQGVSMSYFPDGKPHFVGEYKNGKKSGLWKLYDKQGNVTEQQF
jgi:hypothetical protein